MARLSTTLVQREVASLRDVEEALARQVLYGGDVISNLLEYTSSTVDEAALTGVAAEVLGLDAPHVGELPVASDELKRTVPAEVVSRHAIFPLGLTEETLRIAVSEKLGDEALSDLSFSLGRRIVQCAALHVRIRQALARDYDVALDRRALRGLARLEGRQDPSPSRYPSPLEGTPPLASLPRSPTIPPFGALGTRSLFSNESLTPSVHEAITAPAPPVVPQDEAAAEPTVFSEVPPETKASPSAPIAEPEPRASPLHEAPSPAITLDVSPTSQTAIETVRRPPPADQSRQSLAAWSARERRATELRTRSRHRGPYTAAQAERDLLAAEERDEVLTAFMDFAAQYFEYTALFAVVGEIAEGRDAHGPGASRAEVVGVGVPLELPSVLSRARDKLTYELALLPARGLDAQLARDLQRTAGRQVVALPVAVRGRCVLILYGDDGEQDVQLSEIGDVIAFASLVSNALEAVIRRKKATARADVGTPDPAAALARAARQHTSRSKLPGRDERASALASALEGPPVRSSRSAELARAAELRKDDRASSSSLGPPPPKPTSHPRADRPPAKPASALPPPRSSMPAEVTKPGAAARSLGPAPPKPSASAASDDDDDPAGRADTAPSYRSPIANGRTHARVGQASESSATVAHDIEADAARLVDELLAGNQSAVDSLRLLGEPGLAALMSYFPGPLAPGAQPTAASPDAGPVVSALVRLGQAAVPFLIARSGDANATVRAWAIAILGHLPAADSALTVARRTVDADERVRAAARAAGRRLVRDDRCRPILLDTVFDVAVRPGSKAHASTLALEAIAAWRMPDSVPRLIALVSGTTETAASARWALEVITRQSFGGNETAWRRWWDTHRERHRVEWLIDALMHPDQELRRQALEDLTALSNQYFGYDESLPEDERALGQRRYRHWWETEGRSRFDGSAGGAQ